MNKRASAPYFITLGFSLAAALVRLWSLRAAIDSRGLPTMHPSVVALLALAVGFLALAAGMALRSPGRDGSAAAIRYGLGGTVCAMVAAGLILLGALAEFAQALAAGPGISAPIMVLLGLAGGICCFLTAWSRRRPGPRYPAAELLPVVYILLKLTLNFKAWSTDPIILDYGVLLFAQIFTLLAFFRGAGFALDQGQPRRTLFDGMAAVFFCAGAMMDCVRSLSLPGIITYAGFLLWQLPVIWDLLKPSAPDAP